MLRIAILFIALGLTNCAVLHHIQVSDIDNTSGYVKVPIEVKVSETGVDMKQIENLARATNSKGGDQAGDAAAFIQYFQMGPRTGAPVYTDKYAEKIIYQLHTQCPSGRISGVTSIRETRDYSIIKGEIVKVTAFCLRPRS
jgi:hypothetical protein